MSNPFATFRKNQKIWMAGLVLLALLAFVVAPAIDQVSSALSGGTQNNTTMVSWNGGKMTQGEVEYTSRMNGNVRRFLTNLAEAVIEAGGQPQVPGFAYDPAQDQVMSVGLQLPTDPMEVCRGRILGIYAERLGIQFDDKAYAEFIRFFCDQRITDRQLAEILDESTNGRLSAVDLSETIKKQLTQMIAGQLAQSGTFAQPPGKTYRDFEKIKQTAKVEAFPVVVADYLSKVTGSPTEDEIMAIYDEGSMYAADPMSPQVGFIRRNQANFEFINGDIDVWTDREIAKLTEEEIRAEYDKRVELGQLRVLVETPATETPATETPATETPATETPATETPATETPATETPATETPATETPATETPATETPATETPATETPATESPATETPATESPAAETPAEETPADSGDQSSLLNRKSQFVSFQQDAAGQDADTADTSTPAETGDGLPPVVVQPPQLGVEAAEPAAPEMRIQTFEEAREEVAKSLATAIAAPAMEQAMLTLIDTHMKPYFESYRQYVAFRDADDLPEGAVKNEAPVRPNIKQLAESMGLTYGETGLIDQIKLSQLPVGESMVSQDAGGVSGTIAQIGMSSQLPLFRPVRTNYFNQEAFQREQRIEFRQYLVWKTEQKAAYIPELSEVREEVIDAWKVSKARILAADAAKEIAAKVTTGEAPWAVAITTPQQSLLVQTNPFTWYTRYEQGTGISNVPELDVVGDDFMQNVFSTTPGKVVSAPNQPQTIFYVARVLEYAPPQAELFESFEADPQKAGAFSLAQQEIQQLMADWYQSLERELGVSWEPQF